MKRLEGVIDKKYPVWIKNMVFSDILQFVTATDIDHGIKQARISLELTMPEDVLRRLASGGTKEELNEFEKNAVQVVDKIIGE